MYGCRPGVTILLFRCIEQVFHQLHHHEHFHHHHLQRKIAAMSPKAATVQMNDHSLDYQKLAGSAKDRDDVDHGVYPPSEPSLEKIDNDPPALIKFHHTTAVEFLIFFPFILFVMVWDVMTLGQNDESKGYKFDQLGWFATYFLHSIWSFYVAKKLNKKKQNEIHLKHVLYEHWSLFLAALGLILVNIAEMGENRIWELWLGNITDIFYIILLCVTLVYITEAKIKKDAFKNVKFSWFTTSFGKVVVVIQITLIIHDFLGEGYHLAHTLEEDSHEAMKGWSAMGFVLFFWGIEYHLACIDRITFYDTIETTEENNHHDNNDHGGHHKITDNHV